MFDERQQPESEAEVISLVQAAYAARRPVYSLGGQTSLDYGLPPKRQGLGLELTKLNRVVDYPARDLTVTVEAGIRVADLNALLDGQGQCLPVDIAQCREATLGGALATNTSGSRRFGHGTLRDYVIGVAAIDGRGTLFHGGGRVVKNVAGYDFCKLLTGSLGTLGVITQVTLKVKPLPAASAFVVTPVIDSPHAERLLADLGRSRTTPVAVDWLRGPEWEAQSDELQFPPSAAGWLVAGLEGTRDEVEWMCGQLSDEWRTIDRTVEPRFELDAPKNARLWDRLREYAARDTAAMTLKLSAPPCALVGLADELAKFDANVSWQAHAGSGIMVVRFEEFAPAQISRWLIGRLQPRAQAANGHVVVLRSRGLGDLTRQATWGPARSDQRLMEAVKRQFDPHDILNPGRFVFEPR